MASFKISIFDNFLSGGRVGSSFLKSEKATLKASTRIRSLKFEENLKIKIV